MNLVEELKNLDTNDPGRWPLPIRIAAIVLTLIVVSSAGIYFFVYEKQIPVLEAAERTELELRSTFEQKQRKAANFDAYKAQLAEIERSFGTMLRQLPGKTEVPNLLVDISQTGLAAGLEEKLFQPLGEVQKEFYAELPIKIRLTGGFHELGNFVSGIAALPRIVTLHDVEIRTDRDENASDLVLDVTAKTYRYLDEESSDG